MSENEILDDLKARLEEGLALRDPTVDDLYELATAVAQAKRWHRAAKPQAAALAGLIARGQAMVAGEPAEAVLDCLDVGALLARLEGVLEDEEAHPAALFAVLVDVDEHAAAAAWLGVPQHAAVLVRDAVTLVKVHGDAAVKVKRLGAAYRAAQGIAPDEPAAALWAAVEAAEPDPVELPAEPILPGIAAWIAAEARQAGSTVAEPVPPREGGEGSHRLGKVIAFPVKRLPFRRAEAAAEPFRIAGSSRAGLPVPTAFALAAGPDGRWEVVVYRRGPRPELAIVADPHENIDVLVEADGHAVALADDGRGERSVVLRPEVETWRVTVAGQTFDLVWADAP